MNSRTRRARSYLRHRRRWHGHHARYCHRYNIYNTRNTVSFCLCATVPVNNLGITQKEWNTYLAETRKWDAANPTLHKPHEICTCRTQPQLPRLKPSYHCAARGPYATWTNTRP